MKDIIKTYLEAQIKTDAALAAKYDAEKINTCVEYIVEEAKKYLKNQNGAIEDGIVYKWARDFYNDDIYLKTKKDKKNKESEENAVINDEETAVNAAPVPPKQENKKKEKEAVVVDVYHDEGSLFFGLE